MGKQYITGYKGISFADKEARQKVKTVEENQIELVEDELSMEGISDITYDTLQTTNKTLIGGVNEVNSQLKDIATFSLTKGTDGKVYITKQDGTHIGTGVEVGSDADLSKMTMTITGQTLKLLNNGEQIATVDLPEGSGNVPDNVVTYEEETDDSVVTAENIKLTDTDNNFTSTNVEGALSELFQYASNGKKLIAAAITGKGVETNANDTFQTMATNIGNIQSGGTGITPTGTKEITENGTYDVTNFASALVNVPKNTSSGAITGTFTGADELTKTIEVGSNFTNFLLMTDAFSTAISYGSRLVIFIGVIDSVLRYQIMSNNTGAGVLGYIKSANGNMTTNISGTSITISNFSGTSPTYFKSGVAYRWYAW